MPEPEGGGSVGLKALGETVERLRIEHHIGPRGLAFDAEISESTLTDLERETKNHAGEPCVGSLADWGSSCR
jgi:hypothetical protein